MKKENNPVRKFTYIALASVTIALASYYYLSANKGPGNKEEKPADAELESAAMKDDTLYVAPVVVPVVSELERQAHLVKYSNHTIVDTLSGFTWMVKDYSTIEGRFLKNASWDEAMAWAEKINAQNYAGYNDWRVPSVKEYRTINRNKADRKRYRQIFEDQGAYCFWTSTEISDDVKSYMSFKKGFAVSGIKEGKRNLQTKALFDFSVRLVRGKE